MNQYFDSSVSFRKKTKIVDLAEDYNMPEYEGMKIAFWADPSRPVLNDLISILATSKEELEEKKEEEREEMNNKFYSAVSTVILGTNVEELDFSTAEKAEESFDAPEVDANFMFRVIVRYAMDLLEESKLLKKG